MGRMKILEVCAEVFHLAMFRAIPRVLWASSRGLARGADKSGYLLLSTFIAQSRGSCSFSYSSTTA